MSADPAGTVLRGCFLFFLRPKTGRSPNPTSGVDGSVLEVARVGSDAKLPRVLHHKGISARSRRSAHVLRERSVSYRVHLPQHGPVGEELRLPGVHDDQVEERAPGIGLEEPSTERR